MSSFEKKFGKYAITNLSLVIIVFYGFGYLLQAVNPAFLNYLTLDTYAILHGQIWRLVSWVLVPPDQSNVFFILIAMLFYYSIGTSLERAWGTYRYNVYIFEGLLFTVIGAFAAMGIFYLIAGGSLDPVQAKVIFRAIATRFSTYYVCMSIFLAYAATFPEAGVLFMFIVPVKVKWLGIIYAVLLAFDFVSAAVQGGWITCIAMAASLLNFIIFFARTRGIKRYSPKEVKRRQDFKRAVSGSRVNSPVQRPAGNAGAVPAAAKMRPAAASHRCSICGRTNITDPDLEFRYCSKCEGNYEFCQDHLFGHIHAKNGSAPVQEDTGSLVIEPEKTQNTETQNTETQNTDIQNTTSENSDNAEK